MTKHKHFDTIIAWANGAPVECNTGLGWWSRDPHPTFNPACEYRVRFPRGFRIGGTHMLCWLDGERMGVISLTTGLLAGPTMPIGDVALKELAIMAPGLV